MTNSQATSDRPSTRPRQARPRTVTRPVALPRTRPETLELRDLLEANLQALHALHEEHQRMLTASLSAIGGVCNDLRAELRAIGDARAPWVRAMSETRALLFVALRELIVGAHEAELSMHLPQQEADPHHRTR
ncbi:MAG TPA: hypothetical protein VFT22_16655 [Kofleriaceae bacterium]|nr:hypothetical protein [Kofleriaceae bacterium]